MNSRDLRGYVHDGASLPSLYFTLYWDRIFSNKIQCILWLPRGSQPPPIQGQAGSLEQAHFHRG
jgi:hypothetical protein